MPLRDRWRYMASRMAATWAGISEWIGRHPSWALGAFVVSELTRDRVAGWANIQLDRVDVNQVVDSIASSLGNAIAAPLAGTLILFLGLAVWSFARAPQAESSRRPDSDGLDAAISPIPPDEKLVILFRSYGAPAYETAEQLVNRAGELCFTRGGWPGFAAALFKQDSQAALAEKQQAVEAAIRAGDNEDVMTSFEEFLAAYDKLTATAWHFLRHDISVDPDLLSSWQAADALFLTEFEELAQGNADRDRLKNIFKTRTVEGRDLLTRLANDASTRQLVAVSFEAVVDGDDVVLRGVVDNNSSSLLQNVHARVEKSELCGQVQSSGEFVWYDYQLSQVMLPWSPEGTLSKNVGPQLRGSRFEIARLPNNSPIAQLSGSERESGAQFATAGCNRLTITVFADNLKAQSHTVEFRIILGVPRAEQIAIGDCECASEQDSDS